MKKIFVVQWLIGLGLILSPLLSSATMVMSIPWQNLVTDADFVGVVECELSGGNVAQYKIIDAWKGAPDKASIRISPPTDYWHSPFNVVLPGDRFVVAAHAIGFRSAMMSTSSNSGDPIMDRYLFADYSAPLMQGMDKINPGGKHYLNFNVSSLETLKSHVSSFLQLSDEERELQMLKASAKRSSQFNYPSFKDYREGYRESKMLRLSKKELKRAYCVEKNASKKNHHAHWQSVLQSTSTEEIVHNLLDLDLTEDDQNDFFTILYRELSVTMAGRLLYLS
jgi:hypothetical protein